MNLILPVAGGSTRFGSGKPKFLLTHPSGNTMLYEAIRGIDLSKFNNIYVVFRDDIYKKYKLTNFLRDQFGDGKFKEIIIKETKSQAHTISQALKVINKEESFMVKDCDNYFMIDSMPNGNFICFGSLSEYDSINAGNKSYIVTGENLNIENIVEKKIIGDSFCVGAYAFESPLAFQNSFEVLVNNKVKDEIYLSDIIFNLLLETEFKAVKVKNYIDWGTQKDWDKFRDTYATYFIDIDGVLFKNSARFTEPYWGTSEPLANNIKTIKDLHATGRAHIVLTTSRLESDLTLNQLKSNSVPYNSILFGLPHAKRILINDFSVTNKYKTAESINIERDSDNLSSYVWRHNS